MKKLIAIALLAGAVGYAVAENVNLHFNNRVELAGAAHRIVVVVDPDTVSGGTVVLDKSYSITGTASVINASVNCEIQ
jgi:hypothetical protein